MKVKKHEIMRKQKNAKLCESEEREKTRNTKVTKAKKREIMQKRKNTEICESKKM